MKRPKIYWRDSGLLHALLNVVDEKQLLQQPWVGASWEGFVIEQALDTLAATGRPQESFYFRTSDQYEIDLVLDLGDAVWAVEVKLTSSPTPEDLARLDRSADLIGASHRWLVSKTRRPVESEGRASVDLETFLSRLERA